MSGPSRKSSGCSDRRHVGKQDEIANLVYALKQAGIADGDFVAHTDGVIVPSLDVANKFIGNHPAYELGGRIDGKVSGWLVKQKAAN